MSLIRWLRRRRQDRRQRKWEEGHLIWALFEPDDLFFD